MFINIETGESKTASEVELWHSDVHVEGAFEDDVALVQVGGDCLDHQSVQRITLQRLNRIHLRFRISALPDPEGHILLVLQLERCAWKEAVFVVVSRQFEEGLLDDGVVGNCDKHEVEDVTVEVVSLSAQTTGRVALVKALSAAVEMELSTPTTHHSATNQPPSNHHTTSITTKVNTNLQSSTTHPVAASLR